MKWRRRLELITILARVGTTRFWLPSPAVSPLGAIQLAGEVRDDEPHVSAPLRQMEDWVLSVVTAGHGRHRDASGVLHPVGPGSVTVIAPTVPHWYGTDPGRRWSELFVVFSGPLFDTLAETGVLQPRLPAPVQAGPPATLLRAVVRSEAPDRGSLDRRLLALAGWLSDLGTASTTQAGDGASDDVMERAARELAADVAAQLDLHVLASRHGLSYDTFRRRFSATHRRPPAAYRSDARLAAAVRLLQLTDLGLAEIARRLGYSDEFHFSRRFTARYGESPGRFRRRR